RQRMTLLRSLMIAGCVLHELDQRFPRLLASMPEPPATLDALQHLATGLFKERGLSMPQPGEVKSAGPESAPEISVARANMKKLF
ncbi:TPA: plasmid partitioning/stability family protein, partial [Salmonella enterica subsp. diarizonae serovar 48:i:z]